MHSLLHSLLGSFIAGLYLSHDQRRIVRHFRDLVDDHLRNVVVETHRHIAKPHLIDDMIIR